MTESEVVAEIKRQMATFGSLREAAKQWKLSPTYVSLVTQGKMRPGVSILQATGFERVTLYQRIAI